MNIKKRLENEAKSTHQKILEDKGNGFLSSLEDRVQEPERPNRRRHWKAWLTGAACTAAAAILIICAVLFIPSHKQTVYLEKNFQSSSSDVATLNADLKNFQLNLKDNIISTSLKRTIDGPSGDLLFYKMTLLTSDSHIETNMTVVCNQNYHFNQFSEDHPYQHAEFPYYSVLYDTKIIANDTLGYQTLTAVAKIEGKDEIIYITDYSEITLDENGTFLQFIQDLIQVKNCES